MNDNWNLIELGDLGILRLRGPDAMRFLQGQISNDVERLSTEISQLAGYHNPQGRAIALLRLVQLALDDVLAILPRELVAPVASRLTKFVLRAKVKITDESDVWCVMGLLAPHCVAGESGPASVAEQPHGGAADIDDAFESRARSWAAAQFEEASALAATHGEHGSVAAQLEEGDAVVELPTASALMLPDTMNAQSGSGTAVIIRLGTIQRRWLVISPASESLPLSGCIVGDRSTWQLLDIADGLPQVYGATSEEFVAQMLNLDVLGAIAFDKGCYTGQEVIARAHYRGRVKRRLQRFMTRAPANLAVNDSGIFADGRTFKVVEAAQLSNGCCEFLAVVPLTSGDTGDGSAGAIAVASADVTPSGPGDRLDVEALPLPYRLPA
jgi:folate-binding protein YgfZ